VLAHRGKLAQMDMKDTHLHILSVRSPGLPARSSFHIPGRKRHLEDFPLRNRYRTSHAPSW